MDQELAQFPAEYQLWQTDRKVIARLAQIRRLLIVDSELLLEPYSLERVYPVAGQSPEHRATVLALAAGATIDQPSPLYQPLQGPAGELGAILALPGSIPVGRAAQTILQQITAQGGESVLLHSKDQELLAIFALVRKTKSKVEASVLRLQASKIEVGSMELIIAEIPVLKPLKHRSGYLRETPTGLGLAFEPQGHIVLEVANFAALPTTFEHLRQLRRRRHWWSFWCKL